ncbi:MAG: hypothetical protein ASARMPREDX12_007012 [Alectoria sarmentosa]|nr:MAG: hypothetical protein ASARMPREDX12_007012 [Alectoria sarmentosa]
MALISAKYPDLPEYGVRLDLSYWIDTYLSISSTISALWISIPQATRLSDNSYTTDLPSAFLSVQIPYGPSNTTGTTFTCSVDARWAMGTHSGGPLADLDVDYVQTASIQNTRPIAPDLRGYQYNFLPVDDGSWRRVQIDIDWLNTLTPPLDGSTSGWTSLAALLIDMGMDNSTGIITDWFDLSSVLETVIATLVADGKSRQGYAANGGSLTHISDAMNLLPWDNSAPSQQSLLAGTYVFPPSVGTATPLHWSVVIGDYAYRADSLAYYLALTVLFAHAALAPGHVIYVLRICVCCDAWDSLISLIVLAANSGMAGPSGVAHVFENASAGIERYRTMDRQVRVRALLTSGANAVGQTDVKILFGEKTLAAEYRALEVDKTYG